MYVIVKTFGLMNVWGPFDHFEEARSYALSHLTNLQEMIEGMYVVFALVKP